MILNIILNYYHISMNQSNEFISSIVDSPGVGLDGEGAAYGEARAGAAAGAAGAPQWSRA